MGEPIRSYQLELTRAATLELLRALGVRDRPLPHRFRRQVMGDPNLYMDVRAEGILLWQHPLSGREAQILPLRIYEGSKGVTIDVLLPRMRPATRWMLGVCMATAPIIAWFGGVVSMIPLVGGILCGLWLHYRDHRPVGLERMIDDNFALIDRSLSRPRLSRPIITRDLISAPISSPISAPVPVE
jgi:hypothetical protein